MDANSLITQIIDRAAALGLVAKDRNGRPHWYDRKTMAIDLSACLRGGYSDDQAIPNFSLSTLLAFDDFDFTHDVAGIAACLNRETGEMENCFLPRCARKRFVEAA